jgi:hypothetical protein
MTGRVCKSEFAERSQRFNALLTLSDIFEQFQPVRVADCLSDLGQACIDVLLWAFHLNSFTKTS